MLAQQTIDHLRQLNLTGMIDALQLQREQPVTQELAFEERLALLLEREILHRENRRLDRLLKAARLRVHACIEDIDYRHPRGLEKTADRGTGATRLGAPGPQPVPDRTYRLRQDLARLCLRQPDLPAGTLGALPAPADVVRATGHHPR